MFLCMLIYCNQAIEKANGVKINFSHANLCLRLKFAGYGKAELLIWTVKQ